MMSAPEYFSPRPAAYVAARRVLLDALAALQDHIDSLVLVGAQAVYLHTDAAAREQRLLIVSAAGKKVDERSKKDAGLGTLVVPPMTTDGDLALNTSHLAGSPEIAQTLIAAGFRPGTNPGHWLGTHDVAIDIMVVPHQAGTTSRTARSARIPPHAKNVGRIAPGLEPALIDNTAYQISAFEDDDHRAFKLRVAGPAALVVAKTIKIAERDQDAHHQPDRLKTKDALDTFRLLQAIETELLAEGFRSHRAEPEAARVSAQAVEFLAVEATRSDSLLPRLATEAAFGDPTIAPSFAVLAQQLIDAISDRP